MLHGSEVVISLRGNEIVATASAFGKIIGQSRGWLQIIRQIEIVAPTDATVLVLGETGTGKELIARELHWRSRCRVPNRSRNPALRTRESFHCAPKDGLENQRSRWRGKATGR
jgi:transcriptional regulator of aromatic amino acid metabolism